jgi:tripartite-type tricarboxylate transporter receptor subunit TctC
VADSGQPLRLIVPYPAGGPTDTVARVISQPMSEELGRPVIVVNQAGASGTIGAGAVARAAPDGNTMLINTSIHVILPHLKPVPYEAIADFTHLALVNNITFVLVVNKDLPFKSVAELVAYAKANPGKLNFGSASAGSSSHLAAEQFMRVAGIDMMHIAYKGSSPAITDLIGGRIQVMFEQGPSVFPFVKSGQLRAIAVTSPQRMAAQPEVPTLSESGYPGFSYSNWQGLWGPANMPEKVSGPMIAALRKALQRPAVKQRLMEMGTDPADLYGGDFLAYAKQQYEHLGGIVKSANVKLD